MTTDLLIRPDTRLWRPRDLEILDAATRREFLTMLGAAGLLAACGGEGGGASGADGRRIRTVEGVNGPVEIPAQPMRVATTFYPTLVGLAVLGVPVVAAAKESLSQLADLPAGVVPQGLADPADLVDIGSQDDPNLEALAGARPDLIVDNPFTVEELGDRLVEIAPVVAVEYGGNPDWQVHVAELARVLGREARHTELLAEFRARADTARASLPADVPTLAVVRGDISDGQFRVELRNSFEGIVLAAAGIDLHTGDAPSTSESGFFEASTERLVDILGGADVIAVKVFQGDDAIVREPIFAQLPAAQAGRVATVAQGVWGGSTYPSALALFDDLPRVLATGR